MGVEEEFLLLRPDGAVAPVAAEALSSAGDAAGEMQPEFHSYQLETATPVCRSLDELNSHLGRLRRSAARGAHRAGAELVSVGMPPFHSAGLGDLTPDPRYSELARRYRAGAAVGGACACQVHVGVPDPATRVRVLAGLRPWLSTLLALTANSAIRHGSDSGWSSDRYRSLLQWPSFQPPRDWPGVQEYNDDVHGLIARGEAMDDGSVYLLARLSARYPTVEVRVADACLTTEDATLLAATVRALVTSLVEESAPTAPAQPPAVESGLLHAARHGTCAEDSAASLNRLHEQIRPTLADGEATEVEQGLDRVRRHGNGADRQRRLWTGTGDATSFVAALADHALQTR